MSTGGWPCGAVRGKPRLAGRSEAPGPRLALPVHRNAHAFRTAPRDARDARTVSLPDLVSRSRCAPLTAQRLKSRSGFDFRALPPNRCKLKGDELIVLDDYPLCANRTVSELASQVEMPLAVRAIAFIDAALFSESPAHPNQKREDL